MLVHIFEVFIQRGEFSTPVALPQKLVIDSWVDGTRVEERARELVNRTSDQLLAYVQKVGYGWMPS